MTDRKRTARWVSANDMLALFADEDDDRYYRAPRNERVVTGNLSDRLRRYARDARMGVAR